MIKILVKNLNLNDTIISKTGQNLKIKELEEFMLNNTEYRIIKCYGGASFFCFSDQEIIKQNE